MGAALDDVGDELARPAIDLVSRRVITAVPTEPLRPALLEGEHPCALHDEELDDAANSRLAGAWGKPYV